MFWKLCPVKSSRFLFFSHHFQWKIARATLIYLINFREDLKGGKFQIVKMTWKNAQNFIICRDKNATDQWVLIFTGRAGRPMVKNDKIPSDTGRDGTSPIYSVPCPTLVLSPLTQNSAYTGSYFRCFFTEFYGFVQIQQIFQLLAFISFQLAFLA